MGFNFSSSLHDQIQQSPQWEPYAQEQQTQQQINQDWYNRATQGGVSQDAMSYYQGYNPSMEAAVAAKQAGTQMGGWYDDSLAGKDTSSFLDSSGGRWMPWWEGGNSLEDRTSGNYGKLLGYRASTTFGDKPGRTNTQNLYFDPTGKYTHDAFGGNTIGFLRGIGMVAGSALGMNAAFGAGAAGAGGTSQYSLAGSGAGLNGGTTSMGLSGGYTGATTGASGLTSAGTMGSTASGLGLSGASSGIGAGIGEGLAGYGAVGGAGYGAGTFTGQGLTAGNTGLGMTANPSMGTSSLAADGASSLGMTPSSPGATAIGEGIGSTIPEFTLPQSVTQAGTVGTVTQTPNIQNQIQNKLLTTAAQKLLTGSDGGGDMGLAQLVLGANDAYQTDQAGQKMIDWLNGQQQKIEGYMNPNSPEYSALWQQMSRKDAAAGRNSQYGPRTADFLSRVAQARAQNTTNFTTGTSRALAEALTQRAMGRSAPGVGAALGSNSSIGSSLGDIINAIAGNYASSQWGIDPGSTGGMINGAMSNTDIWDMINGGSDLDLSDWWS